MAVIGRPRTLNDDKCEAVILLCESMSLVKACEAAGVKRETFNERRDLDPSLSAKYARAVQVRTEAMADSILEIADDPDIPSDQKRIMVDTRKWIASKMLPKVYGDKLNIEGDSKLQIEVTYAAAPALPQPSEHVLDAEIVPDSGDLE